MSDFKTGGLRGPEALEALGGRFGTESTGKTTESGKLGGTVVKTVGNGTSALGEQMKNTPMSTIPQEELGRFSPTELADEMAAARSAVGKVKGQDAKGVGEGGLEEGKEVEEKEEKEEGGGKEDVEEKQGKMVVSNVDEIERQRPHEYNDFETRMKLLFLSKQQSERGLNTANDYIAVATQAGFEDITEVYAAVRRFEQKIDTDPDFKNKPELKAEVKQSLRFGTSAIFKENEPAIRAGWNLEGTHSQLELYRAGVQKAGNLADRFKVIIEQDPSNPDKFKENAELLIKYISQDTAAAGGASMDPRYLNLANNEIRNAQLCLGTYASVENLIKYMAETYAPKA